MADTLPPVLQVMASKGYAVFTRGAYNLNLFGIRSPSRKAGQFDDLMGCAYRTTDGGPWVVRYWPATTDPGLYYLHNPSRVSGTAILAPGQYRGAYVLGLHAGKYEALVQRGAEVTVYRDRDRDGTLDLDPSTLVSGYFGINLHASSQRGDGTGESTSVGKWSAGCQVHATEAGFRDMMALARKSLEEHPSWSRFTYTLLDQWW